jgi:hypothetical protein
MIICEKINIDPSEKLNLAYEGSLHSSPQFLGLRYGLMLSNKSFEEQFLEYVEELKREENLPNPSKAFLDLLKMQIQ